MHVLRLLILLFLCSCGEENSFDLRMEKLSAEAIDLKWGEFIEDEWGEAIERPAGTERKIIEVQTSEEVMCLSYRIPFRKKSGILKILKNCESEVVTLQGIKSFSIDRTTHEIILKIDGQDKVFNLSYLSPRNKFLFIPSQFKRKEPPVLASCGGKNQGPCFRGIGWREDLSLECFDRNPAFFCQKGLQVYCLNKTQLTCL